MNESQEGDRAKGSSILAGKIIKGTLNDAPQKMRVSSIPSKHETVIYKNIGKPAFGNSRSRFESESQCLPGPGNYQVDPLTKVISKKGLGFFASESKLHRLEQINSSVPGPGAYRGAILGKAKAKSVLNLNAFAAPRLLFKQELEHTSSIPGPGMYNREDKAAHSSTIISFKSKVERFQKAKGAGPPLGKYAWAESFHMSQQKSIFGQFEHKKTEPLKGQSAHIDRLMGVSVQKQGQLGPGSYNPTFRQTTKSFLFRENQDNRYSYINNTSNTSNRPTTHLQFNYQTMQACSKTITSMFKSQTKRSPIGENNQSPDPSKYSPFKVDRKSHLINFTKKWI